MTEFPDRISLKLQQLLDCDSTSVGDLFDKMRMLMQNDKHYIAAMVMTETGRMKMQAKIEN